MTLTMKRFFFSAGLLASIGASNAAERVFGFELGQPLAVSVTCTGPDGFEAHPNQGYCVTGSSLRKLTSGSDGPTGIVSALFKYNDLPFWTGSRLKFILSGGKLVGIISSTGGQTTHNSVTRDLTAKYGQPSRTAPQTMRNRLGATFDNTISLWEAGELVVTYTPMMEDMRAGQVDFLTTTGAEIYYKSITDRSQTPARPL